jgi:serine/threonine protein kinase
VEIALEFSRAMAYMHSRVPKIIHRDLKPANIMVGGSSFMLSDTSLLLHSAGIIKVADFGLCKSLPQRGTHKEKDADRESLRTDAEAKDTYRLTGALPASQRARWRACRTCMRAPRQPRAAVQERPAATGTWRPRCFCTSRTMPTWTCTASR